MPICVPRFSMIVCLVSVGLLPARPLAGFMDAQASPASRATTQPASDASVLHISDPRLLPGLTQAQRCNSLVQAMHNAATPLAGVERGLAAARCAIVLECAGPLSRELHGIAPNREALTSGVATGKDCLKVVAEALQGLPEGFDEDRRRVLQDRLDMLRAFADLFAALGAADGSQRATAQLTDACIGLAVFVDDANLGIAESAKLWQGVAYRRAGRADRTLNLLRPAIGSLRSSRVDFFMRMERCRALVDRGHFVAAQSLAMRLEKRVNVWLIKEDDSARKRAADCLRLLRGEGYMRWAADLRKRGEEAQAKGAEDEMRRVLGDESPLPALDEVLVLDQTIAGLPDWEITEPAPTTQPAAASK